MIYWFWNITRDWIHHMINFPRKKYWLGANGKSEGSVGNGFGLKPQIGLMCGPYINHKMVLRDVYSLININ